MGEKEGGGPNAPNTGQHLNDINKAQTQSVQSALTVTESTNNNSSRVGGSGKSLFSRRVLKHANQPRALLCALLQTTCGRVEHDLAVGTFVSKGAVLPADVIVQSLTANSLQGVDPCG